jgi:predicted nucleic acid-binding protein
MDANAAALTRPIVLDNTVLTNFALVNRADLVMRLWSTAACTTPAASAEYGVGVSRGLLPSDAWADLPVVTPTEEESNFASSLSPRLGAGERTCLAVAVHRQGLFASDDLDARRAAQWHGVPTTGTVGILILCVRRGYLPYKQADVLLAEMIALGYRSPVGSLEPLMNE